MKKSDLQTGIEYSIGGSASYARREGFVLDPNVQYSRSPYFNRQLDRIISPNYSGKGTHILVLMPLYYADAKLSKDHAARYTLKEYQKGKAVPKGWRAALETLANIRETQADFERQQAAEREWDAAQKVVRERHRQDEAILIAETTELLAVYGIHHGSIDSSGVRISHDQIRSICAALSEKATA